MIGDISDIVVRLKKVLPSGWFSDQSPNLDALLSGLGWAWSGIYNLLEQVKSQARISTASGIFLDIASQDFCGNLFPRRASEPDAAYRQRILNGVLEPRATRPALETVIENLTGFKPFVFEPLNPLDTCAYNVNLGYNICGGYGTRSMPYQFFVTVKRPDNFSFVLSGGYCIGNGGYNTAPLFYGSTNEWNNNLSDADIYATVASIIPTASIAWTKIIN